LKGSSIPALKRSDSPRHRGFAGSVLKCLGPVVDIEYERACQGGRSPFRAGDRGLQAEGTTVPLVARVSGCAFFCPSEVGDHAMVRLRKGQKQVQVDRRNCVELVSKEGLCSGSAEKSGIWQEDKNRFHSIPIRPSVCLSADIVHREGGRRSGKPPTPSHPAQRARPPRADSWRGSFQGF
jgi:hypothetical protein